MNKRHIKKIKTGAIVMVMSTAIVMNLAPSTFALGGDAKGTGITENTDIDDREHPNKPEGSWKIEKPKMLPPSYDGHVHVPIPFVDGKLAVNMDRLDRTNSQIEFSINKKYLNKLLKGENLEITKLPNNQIATHQVEALL